MQGPLTTTRDSRQIPAADRTSLLELARLFLKIGVAAFGGPPAHIAMMEDEVVSRRGWLTREQFVDFLGATNLIPGPNSTEMAIHVGRVQAGWPGLLVAGASFILPSAVMVTALAWVYLRFGSLPQVAGVLYGVKPIVIAVIVQAVFKLAKTAVKSTSVGVVGALAVLATAFGADQLAVLAGGGFLTGLVYGLRSGKPTSPTSALLTGGTGLTGIAVGSGFVMPFSLTALFLVFLKIGAILFGGGYVLVALIRSNLVTHLGWITERQLLDAIAMGQVTPGPISTTATFIGYLVRGWSGALVATVAIFLPSFFLAGAVGALAGRIRQSKLAAAFIDGVNAGAVALMAEVGLMLGKATFVDGWAWGIGVVSALLLLRFQVNATWVILGGAALGLLLRGLH